MKTLRTVLKRLIAASAARKLRRYRGKIDLRIDVDALREDRDVI
ncbi:MAG: hypothetical protein ACK5O9_00520 [Holosporales bacterium]|jgi:hypothetical protein